MREPPKRIYKYQPATMQVLGNLSAGQIWFSDPRSFNDPFDCAFDQIGSVIEQGLASADAATCIEIIGKVTKPETMTAFLQESESEIRRITKESILHHLPQIFQLGVSCFSDRKDDLLMWGHYADSHKGLCLEFSTEISPFNDRKRLRPVMYGKEFPKLDLARLKEGAFDHLLDFIFAKSHRWRYEREWRMLHKEQNHLYHYPCESLTAIYFGARLEHHQQGIVCHLLEKMPTKLFKMNLRKNEFRLVKEKLTYESIDYRC
jgi:hypothetical protein